jgi:hypothetical protein
MDEAIRMAATHRTRISRLLPDLTETANGSLSDTKTTKVHKDHITKHVVFVIFVVFVPERPA